MYRKYVYERVTWYDFRDIREDEAVEVGSLYALEPGVIKTITNISTKNKVTKFDNCIVVSMDVPCSIDTGVNKKIAKKPVHFVLGDGFLITVRFDDVRGFKDMKKEYEHNRTPESINSSLYMFAALLSQVYEHMHHDISKQLPVIAVEHSDYAHKKYLIDYSRMIQRHESVIEAFRAVAVSFFDDDETNRNLDQIINEVILLFLF